MFSVELFPPGWIGRGFQLLALSIDPHRVRDITVREAVFGSKDDYLALLNEALEIAKGFLSQGLLQRPRLFGNDPKPVSKLVGTRLKQWDEAAEVVVGRLSKGEIDLNEPRVKALMLMKLNIFEYLRSVRGGVKPERVKPNPTEISPASFALALVGGLLSKVGRVGDKGVYLLPAPEVGLNDLFEIAPHYTVTVVEGEYQLPPLGRLLSLPRVQELPVSLDTLVLVYGSALLATVFDASPGELCGSGSVFDRFLLASISETGNRAILNELTPMVFSGLLCRLGSKPLTALGELLGRGVQRGLCPGGSQDPGLDAVAQCVGKLYLYAVTGNNIYLYDCTRLLRGAAESKQCLRMRDSLLWCARSVAEVASAEQWIPVG
ncbi:hypothetical protein PYJP_06190 [Pyrofollis japonicus]|nr:hypothetical protein PYJP_06190 [Pyrofollis japonicus]